MTEHTGFLQYQETGTITKEFINDFNYWCRRTFRYWTLFIDYDEFNSICWTALLERLPKFDPAIATIQTYCISTINNEAWRRYTKNKGVKHECDCDDTVVQNMLYNVDDHCSKLQYYIECAKHLGIDVDREALQLAYQEQCPGVFVKALDWWLASHQGDYQ